MAVHCLKYGTIRKTFVRLAGFPLSQAHQSSGDLPAGNTIADLTEDDELIIFGSRRALTFRRAGLRCKVSLLIQEPKEVQRVLYAVIGFFRFRFHRILTHSDLVLERCANAEKWIHGGAWVDTSCAGRCKKTSKISIIASPKKKAEGHKLRHEIIDWARSENIELDAFGPLYQQLDDKIDGHAPYYFSVVIENSRAAGYFTEKIMDAMLCESVPIYWGDPEIGKHFDVKGIIICNTRDDLMRAIASARVDWFHQHRNHIAENRKRALGVLSSELAMSRISGE